MGVKMQDMVSVSLSREAIFLPCLKVRNCGQELKVAFDSSLAAVFGPDNGPDTEVREKEWAAGRGPLFGFDEFSSPVEAKSPMEGQSLLCTSAPLVAAFGPGLVIIAGWLAAGRSLTLPGPVLCSACHGPAWRMRTGG